jgi:eukaryotic-like serine/threonine-protein kinase
MTRIVSSETAKAPVQPGDVVADKYRIERVIGSGGMGVVVAALHLAMGERVALKFVTAERATDREAVGRLMREARATFRLRSEHTVRVHDVGELASGVVYIVMELLDGRDLKAELEDRGKLPEPEVVRLAFEACDALEEAHALGIVHRDLKPHNMFLAKTARGTTILKILDFGMSKLDPQHFDPNSGPLTRPETALGTPRYMAPEQWKSAAEVDARADIWALGVVMYELLTGKAPLPDVRGMQRQARLLAGAIPDPRELQKNISDKVARAVMKCLRPDPSVRWGSVAHLLSALQDAYPAIGATVERVEVTRTDVTRAVPRDVMKRQAAAAFAEPLRAGPPTTKAPPTARASPMARHIAGESRAMPPPSPEDFDAATEVRAPLITPPEMVEGSGALPPSRRLQGRAIASTLRSATMPPEVVEALAKRNTQESTARMPSSASRAVKAAMPTSDPPSSAARPIPQAPEAPPAMVPLAPSGPPLARTAPLPAVVLPPQAFDRGPSAMTPAGVATIPPGSQMPSAGVGTIPPGSQGMVMSTAPMQAVPSHITTYPPPQRRRLGPRAIVLIILGGILSFSLLVALGWAVARAMLQ